LSPAPHCVRVEAAQTATVAHSAKVVGDPAW